LGIIRFKILQAEKRTNRAHDLNGIHALDVAVETLPLGNPGLRRVGECDQTLEDLGGAFLDCLLRVSEREKTFAVRTTFLEEFLGELSQSRSEGRRRASVGRMLLLWKKK
jgi:hypothetical protein